MDASESVASTSPLFFVRYRTVSNADIPTWMEASSTTTISSIRSRDLHLVPIYSHSDKDLCTKF